MTNVIKTVLIVLEEVVSLNRQLANLERLYHNNVIVHNAAFFLCSLKSNNSMLFRLMQWFDFDTK